MLDAAFLVLAVIAIYSANHGVYRENICNAALVVGLAAAVAGYVVAFLKDDITFAGLNSAVALFAFLLRFAARHLAKLYNDKIRRAEEEQQRYRYLRSRTSGSVLDPTSEPVCTDESFFDEELRFGKGGFTDNKL